MLKGHYSVGSCHYITELEVNLVLSLCNLVMRSLDSIAHFLKCQANISTAVFAVVDRIKVEVACVVAKLQGRLAFLVCLEQEELTLGTYVEAVTHFSRFVNYLLKNISRVTLERCYIVCFINRADKSCSLCVLVLSPREDCPCVKIGMQIHIRFINSYEAVNRRAVEHTIVVKRFFKL